MDLEQLTKHQLVLLALLISFVTSIATGIVTVSLMQQAPQGVTRTINQIVERTVQTVVPAAVPAAVGATTIKTVVVKEDDATAESIATVQKSIVRFTEKGGDELIARGVIVDSTGLTLTDAGAFASSKAEKFEAILSDGTRVPATIVSLATSSPVATLNVTYGTSTAAMPAVLADISKVRLGQSVIRIGGKGGDSVGEGVMATLPREGFVEASVSSATPGSVLLTLFGEVIGIATADSLAEGSYFYSVAFMPKAPAAPKAPPKP